MSDGRCEDCERIQVAATEVTYVNVGPALVQAVGCSDHLHQLVSTYRIGEAMAKAGISISDLDRLLLAEEFAKSVGPYEISPLSVDSEAWDRWQEMGGQPRGH